jgi:hypothetical protein
MKAVIYNLIVIILILTAFYFCRSWLVFIPLLTCNFNLSNKEVKKDND